MNHEYTVLCDDGEEITVQARDEMEAMQVAREHRYRPVSAERELPWLAQQQAE